MLVDTIMAQLRDAGIDLNAPIAMPPSNWEMACLIGKSVSLVNHGFEDHFDGMDWEEAALELRRAIADGADIKSRADILKYLQECNYDLTDYA